MSFDKVKRLQEKAIYLRLLLEHYAKVDGWKNGDVAYLVQHMTPLLEQVEQGEVIPPMGFDFGWYFYNTESPLFGKYPCLSAAAGNFSTVLEDWESPGFADDRNQANWLRERVTPFRRLLEHYAKSDEAANQLLTVMKPLLDDINCKKVIPPIVNEYRWWFTNRESPLFNKYPDLTEAASNYDAAVEDGWFITGNGKSFGRS